MQPFRPMTHKEVKVQFDSLVSDNQKLREENETLKADLADAKADLVIAKADAAELKLERTEFKENEDVIALKALNQTEFMALTAAERDIMIFKFMKAI